MAVKRRWGYLVWVVAGLVVAVPEITAAVDQGALPFTTISEMVGHLERIWNPTELIVIAVIVFMVFSTVRVPPQSQSGRGAARGGASTDTANEPKRTPGGRLTLQDPPPVSPTQFDEQDAPRIFAAAAVLSFALVAGATWAAIEWWDDPRHFHPAYVLYGLVGLLWLVVPTVVGFLWAKDVPFPTLFRSIANLEDWLRARSWSLGSLSLGPALAWLISYMVLWGLVVLLLHLTFYPYPDITHILNPHG
jgi:hypothetical protein